MNYKIASAIHRHYEEHFKNIYQSKIDYLEQKNNCLRWENEQLTNKIEKIKKDLR